MPNKTENLDRLNPQLISEVLKEVRTNDPTQLQQRIHRYDEAFRQSKEGKQALGEAIQIQTISCQTNPTNFVALDFALIDLGWRLAERVMEQAGRKQVA